jgi:hypothetical protein
MADLRLIYQQAELARKHKCGFPDWLLILDCLRIGAELPNDDEARVFSCVGSLIHERVKALLNSRFS